MHDVNNLPARDKINRTAQSQQLNVRRPFYNDEMMPTFKLWLCFAWPYLTYNRAFKNFEIFPEYYYIPYIYGEAFLLSKVAKGALNTSNFEK